MSAAPELKYFSILLAWEEDNHDAGEYAWSGLAADKAEAIKLAREAAAPSHNGYTDECEECGCTDNDGTDICPDCGGKITTPKDIEQYMPTGIVLDSMEGCNMWAAPEGLKALKGVVHPDNRIDDNGDTVALLLTREQFDAVNAAIARLEGRA